MPYFAEKCKLKHRSGANNRRDFLNLCRPYAQLDFSYYFEEIQSLYFSSSILKSQQIELKKS